MLKAEHANGYRSLESSFNIFEYIGSSYEVALYGAHSERRIFDFAHETACLSGESSTDDDKTGDCAYASYGFHIDRIEPVDVISDDILSRS